MEMHTHTYMPQKIVTNSEAFLLIPPPLSHDRMRRLIFMHLQCTHTASSEQVLLHVTWCIE